MKKFKFLALLVCILSTACLITSCDDSDTDTKEPSVVEPTTPPTTGGGGLEM